MVFEGAFATPGFAQIQGKTKILLLIDIVRDTGICFSWSMEDVNKNVLKTDILWLNYRIQGHLFTSY